MGIEAKLLSKVIDEQNFYILTRFNVTVHDFETYPHVYEFVRKYVKEFGQTPDRRTVVEECSDFEYEPDVYDAFHFLCKKLKDRTAKRRAFELLQHQAKSKFKTLEGSEFVKWLRTETQRIEETTTSDFQHGTNYATNGQERLEMYEEAKDPNNRMFIPTPYKKLTEWLGGGFEIGDYVLLLAFTNVGKSWLASDCGLASWVNGFGVMHYSPELSKRQQLFRLDTLLGKFDNVKLRRGKLDNEEKFREFVKRFSPDKQTVPYIVKTMEDLPDGLTLEVIEHDLQMHPEIKMVIIDGFNLMVHSHGDGTRNKMTYTSRRLRQLFGKYNVTGIVVHQTSAQSQKEKQKEDEDGMRLINPPELTDFSETSAVIQDSATTLTFDAYDGIGKLAIRKAREPNVGKVLELVTQFNEGIIKEPSTVDYF